MVVYPNMSILMTLGKWSQHYTRTLGVKCFRLFIYVYISSSDNVWTSKICFTNNNFVVEALKASAQRHFMQLNYSDCLQIFLEFNFFSDKIIKAKDL